MKNKITSAPSSCLEDENLSITHLSVLIDSIFYFGAILFILIVASCKEEIYSIPDTIISPIPNLEAVIFPRIEISAPGILDYISKEDYKVAEINILGGDFFADLSSDIEIRGRGNSTWDFPKKPYQIRFEEKEEVLGMPKDKRWVLLANYTDKSMLRNTLGFAMGKESNLDWTPESRFVDLYINGDYRGTYQICQKVEESSNRVNIDDDGYLLEVDQEVRIRPKDITTIIGNHLYNIKEPKLTKKDDKYLYIENYLRQTDEAIWGDNFDDPEIGYQKYLDVDAMVDWYLVNEIARNTDSKFFTSVFMNLKPGGKLKMGPLWDFDLGFGNVDYNDNYRTDGFFLKDEAWMKRLFEDPAFVEKVKQRFIHFYNKKDQFIHELRERADYLQETQEQNYERWETLGTYVWPNKVYFETFDEEVDYLVNWLDERMEWLYVAYEEL